MRREDKPPDDLGGGTHVTHVTLGRGGGTHVTGDPRNPPWLPTWDPSMGRPMRIVRKPVHQMAYSGLWVVLLYTVHQEESGTASSRE